MSNSLQLFLTLCSILFGTIVIRLLFTNKIGERHSVIWLTGTLLILILAGNPHLIDICAKWLGIDYPPSLLFLISTLVLLLFNLYQTIQMTILSKKLKDISQHIALNKQDTDLSEVKINHEHVN